MTVSDHRELLIDSVRRMLSDRSSPEVVAACEGVMSAPLWDVFEAAGLPAAGLAEDLGGAGASPADLLTVVRECGRYAAPIPFAESAVLAAPLLAALPDQEHPRIATLALTHPGTSAPRLLRAASGWVLSGGVARVPWAGCADRIVVLSDGPEGPLLVSLDPSDVTITPGQNLAGEPRDDLRFDDVAVAEADVGPPPAGIDAMAPWSQGAICRAAAMAGALERALELTVAYTTQRHQFGRPIARFQAVQQQLAVAAADVAAARSAVDLAIDTWDTGGPSVRAAAIAKCRTGEAAGVVAEIVHQLHGAIGITREHQLHHFTRRLWAWRDEYGSDGEWATVLGHLVLRRGSARLWPDITAGHPSTDTEATPQQGSDPVERAADALRRGGVVVLCDAADRAGEGDIVVAAEHATAEVINLMSRHARGVITLALTDARCRELGLVPQAPEDPSRGRAWFTQSIAARDGITSGISAAADRARTIQVAVDPSTHPGQLASPGHVFPVVARDDGPSDRPTSADAAVELCRRAGLAPGAVLCGILDAAGRMAGPAELEHFCVSHDVALVKAGDLHGVRTTAVPAT